MRIGIVGLGLIGGSLGRAIHDLHQPIEVLGVVRSAEAAAEARRLHAADRVAIDLSVLAGADVVVIATPIDQIEDIVDQVAHLTASGTVITDVASVKRPVRAWAQRLPEPGLFLGGHPVAGKAQSGLGASEPALFKDEPWIFTPLERQDLQPFQPWFDVVRAIGARPFFLTPEEHDRQIAYLSHLAFTVSAAFAETVDHQADSALAGPGFRSMIRLAGGNAAMYESIARENREPLVDAIDRFSATLQQFRDRIQRQDHVRELFEAGAHAAV